MSLPDPFRRPNGKHLKARARAVPARPDPPRSRCGPPVEVREAMQAVAPRLKHETLGQLLKRHIPQRDYLIDPWLRQGESALLYSAPGVGKSMLTLTLALAVAGGGRVLDWTAPAPRRVYLVDGEMAMADLQERAKALLPAVEGIDADEAQRNLFILARQGQAPDANFPDLATPEGQRVIINKCRRGGVDLLILDNLSTLFSLEDENSAAAVRPAVSLLMRLKQANIGCLLIHHTSKAGTNYRGSTMLATTFEAIIGLTKSEQTKDVNGPAFEMVWDKYRAKRRDEVTMPRTVHLREVDGRSQWVAEKAARAQLQEFVAAVQSGKFASQKALAEHFAVNASTVTRWKNDAIHKHGLMTEKAFEAYLDGSGEEASEDF